MMMDLNDDGGKWETGQEEKPLTFEQYSKFCFHSVSIYVKYDAYDDPLRFNYPSIASCGRLQFRHQFFGFISCPLNHGKDFMCHVFHR